MLSYVTQSIVVRSEESIRDNTLPAVKRLEIKTAIK